MNIDLKDFPDPEGLPDDFVVILDSTGMKATNRRSGEEEVCQEDKEGMDKGVCGI